MIAGERAKPISILMIEDNPGDVRLTVEIMKDTKIHNCVDVVGDGEAAIAYLMQEGEYAGKRLPDLILLDLSLPKKSGLEVLAEIKQDPRLRRIPVVVLTASAAERDVVESYDLHANCYITKPISLDKFIAVVKAIEHFWLCIVKLPPLST